MFVIFYTVNLYTLYIYDFFHILLSVWHTYGSMECMYVCMHVYMYVQYSFLFFQSPTHSSTQVLQLNFERRTSL